MTSLTATVARRADSFMNPLAHAVRQLAARDSSCEDGDTSARCEKPYQSTKIVGITVGITAAVLIGGTCILLFFLHKRRQRIDSKEDAAIDFELDGDVDDHPTMGKPPKSWQRQASGQTKPQENPFEPGQQQPQENPFEPLRR
ncbi:hypothetical protein Cob_v008162 [Colletotrichum orbiculare MAFF 240422]|uniref:Uncharacterized protein n=1 Tax=Colletotrichum orbiculare (strain 104-T / ATCC 96160 / CBS 514.97 / LARS 414 / MAFF 240422) TaxID=1213857 RepID=N4VVD8_COLOR|nr:hypothetical protein Cob_v008162 [Colletotrichum orbiculare MAFF 240422]